MEANADPTIFMQGNPPCHAAKSTKWFLSSRNIIAFLWPLKSSDINTIENYWSVWKQKVYEKQKPTKKVFLHKIFAKYVWAIQRTPLWTPKSERGFSPIGPVRYPVDGEFRAQFDLKIVQFCYDREVLLEYCNPFLWYANVQLFDLASSVHLKSMIIHGHFISFYEWSTYQRH